MYGSHLIFSNHSILLFVTDSKYLNFLLWRITLSKIVFKDSLKNNLIFDIGHFDSIFSGDVPGVVLLFIKLL